MGNHEFCEDCGESDFHLTRPCDPLKVKERKANQLEFLSDLQRAQLVLTEFLQEAGYSCVAGPFFVQVNPFRHVA